MGRVLKAARVGDAGAISGEAQRELFAIKVLENLSLRQGFISEYERLRALSHASFPSAHELAYDEAEGRVFSVLEWVDGVPLYPRRLETQGEFVAIASALLRALGHLHRHGLAHGDLAPANILQTGDAQSPLKILDLGAGGAIGDGGGRTSGVLAYAAPERLRGQPLSVQSDLWSIGAVLFGMLHGCHPFPGYPRQSDISAGPLRKGLSPHRLDPWLSRFLCAQPDARYPSTQSALDSLSDLLDSDLGTLNASDVEAATNSPPFVDLDGALSKLIERLEGSIAQKNSGVFTIYGEPGSGRSRFLDELAGKIAARGHRVLREQVLPSDTPGACLARLRHRLIGVDSHGEGEQNSPLNEARMLLSLCAQRSAPLVVLLDDSDRVPEELRRALNFIQESVTEQPQRVGPLIWLSVGEQASSCLHLRTWRSEDIGRFLSAIFPERRISSGVKHHLESASRGIPQRLVAIIERSLTQGLMRVTPVALELDEDFDVAENQTIEVAAERLGRLREALRFEASLLAHARSPLPISKLSSEALGTLQRSGMVLIKGQGKEATALLRDTEMVAAAKDAFPRETVFRELAERWAKEDGTHANQEACIYRVLAGEQAALEEARGALCVAPTGAMASLIGVLESSQWPKTPEEWSSSGDAWRSQGEHEKAEKAYRRAAMAGGEEGARALHRLGELEGYRSRHAKAIAAYQESLEMSPEAVGADTYAGLAQSAIPTGRLKEGEQWCNEGLRRVGNAVNLTWSRLTVAVGLIHWYRGELNQAQTRLDDAWQKREESAIGLVDQAAILTALGLVAHRREDLDTAQGHYTQALKVGEQADDAPRVLTALQNLAVVLHQRGSFAEALATYQEAAALARGLGQVGREIQLAGNLGNLWRYLGKAESAKRVLTRGLERAESVNDVLMRTSILLLLGEVASDAALWQEAEGHLKAALESASTNEILSEEVESLLALTRLATEQGRSADALLHGKSALKKADESGRAALRAQANASLSDCYAIMDEGQELSRAHAESARSEAHLVANPDDRWPIHRASMRAAKSVGDLKRAQEEAHELKRLLQEVTDAVPASYRETFRSRRDRHRAWREAESMTLTHLRVERDDERSHEHWTRLLEVARRMASEHNPKVLLEYIMDSAILLCGAERGFLLLTEDGSEGELPVRVARNIDQENIRNTRFKISRSIAKRVIESGEPLLTIDAMEDDRYRDQLSVHDLKLRSVLCLPMTVRGRVIGAIYLDNRFQSSAFDERDSIQMQAFAGQAAVALDTARLLERMEHAQGELVRARQEVEELNTRLREQLEDRTQQLEATHRVVIRQQRQLKNTHVYERIIGSSDALRRVFQIMDRLLDNNIPVLIEGESGTGKELVARAIHFNGARRDAPFIAVNCGAIPHNLLESELFGHVRGAFTGATTDKAGLFEAAHGGTLLLDELGELPLEMQVKLLRVLQSGDIQKVGDTQERHVDVRIVAATNRKLQDEVAAGRFREDLFYRLAVIPLRLPPLRERREDIPALTQHFMAANKRAGVGAAEKVSSKTLALLCKYDWPGNIRQLEMVLKNACLFSDTTLLEPSNFSAFPEILDGQASRLEGQGLSGRKLADIEREAIMVALRDTPGNKKRAAEQLGIDRRTLYNKLAAYKIVIEKKPKLRQGQR